MKAMKSMALLFMAATLTLGAAAQGTAKPKQGEKTRQTQTRGKRPTLSDNKTAAKPAKKGNHSTTKGTAAKKQ